MRLAVPELEKIAGAKGWIDVMIKGAGEKLGEEHEDNIFDETRADTV